MTLAYQRTRVDGVDFRGGSRADRTRTWPDLRVSWRDIPVPAALDAVITGANIGAGWAHSKRTSAYGATGGFVRGGTDDQFPLELGIRLAGGVSATYTATLTRGAVDDPTGDAENRAANHALRVSGAFAPPAFMQPRITAPIRATLSFADDVQRRCRFGFGGTDGGCVPYVDTGLRTIDLTLDAALADLSIGLRLDYTDRRNRVGTQTGSKQFQIGLFGRFEFASGPLPAGFR